MNSLGLVPEDIANLNFTPGVEVNLALPGGGRMFPRFCYLFLLSFFATFCNKQTATPDNTATMTPYRCQKNVPFFRSCRRYSQAKCGRVRSKRWCSLTICPSLSQYSGSLWPTFSNDFRFGCLDSIFKL